jgi:hypothetical protein
MGLLAVVALFVFIAARVAGAWAIGHDHADVVLVWLAATAGLIVGIQVDVPARRAEAGFWTVLLAGALFAFASEGRELAWVPCLVTGTIGLWLARASLQLVRTLSSGLLWAGQRR